MMTMTGDEHSSIQTRSSLLNRLREQDNSEGWREFYLIYGKVVRDFAIKAGLTDTEADEVVQETAIGIARHLPEYRYDPKVCRFKTWVLNLTSWRIQDQLKKRKPGRMSRPLGTSDIPASLCDDTASTATINRVPDPCATNLDDLFENEYRRNILATALDRIKEKFSLKQYQIFDLLVVKEWPPVEVARSLGATLTNVYVTKHRVSAAVKKEIKRLEMQLEERVQREPT